VSAPSPSRCHAEDQGQTHTLAHSIISAHGSQVLGASVRAAMPMPPLRHIVQRSQGTRTVCCYGESPYPGIRYRTT
jgi:hypothetical protein